MAKLIKGATLIVLLHSLALSAQAQSITAKTDRSGPIKLQTSIGLQSNMYELSADQFSSAMRIGISPVIEFKSGMELSSGTSLSQKLNGNTKTTVSNTQIGLNLKPITLSETLRVALGSSIVLPTNVDDYDDNSFRTQIEASGGLTFKPADRLGKYLSFSSNTSLAKNIHKYERSNMGLDNMSYELNQSLGISSKVSKKISVAVSFLYSMSWAYNNNFYSQFTDSQSISYKIDKSSTMALAHSNGGDALSYDGKDHNIKFFDGRTSTVTATLKRIF